MADDRWFQLLEDTLDDIPARIKRLKTSYTQRTFFFLILIGLGAVMMATAGDIGLVAIGGFVAITGVAGIMTLSTMYHNQLCLYRSIIEMRRLNGAA